MVICQRLALLLRPFDRGAAPARRLRLVFIVGAGKSIEQSTPRLRVTRIMPGVLEELAKDEAVTPWPQSSHADEFKPALNVRDGFPIDLVV
jgi:hypothetical protein